MKALKIAVLGTGYVGLGNAVLLAQFSEVGVLVINRRKVEMRNQEQLPIEVADPYELL